MYWMLMVVAVLLLIMISFLITNYKYSEKKLKKSREYSSSLLAALGKLQDKKKEYHDRIIELEDMKGDAFQVKLRNEIIEVKVDFTKLEMVLILSGINLLMKRSKNVDDARIYIQLIDKINGFIGNMKEGEDQIGIE